MVYAFQLGKGFIGAGWNKYKNAAGTVMLWGLVHYRDYAYAQAFYTITEDLSGKVGTSQLFEVSKTTYDSTGSCWRGWAYSVAETVCFNDFKWGHPRVSGRLNDNVVTFGTSIGTMTNIKNRALTSATWVNMGSSLISKLCADSTYTDIHAHSDINGFYTFHLSPPTATGETYNLSCDGTTTDLGG
jgi:hypothetical protein